MKPLPIVSVGMDGDGSRPSLADFSPTPGRVPPGHYEEGGPGGKLKPFDHVAQEAVRTLLRMCGQDPGRDGLVGTPDRVCRMLKEMTNGYNMDPKDILSRLFDEKSDEVIIVQDIEFTSLCEHHLLPFVGTCDIGYLPGHLGKVVGLSKLARLVECFARRFQVQERMTREIAEAMEEHLLTRGVAVVVRARHSCMGCRGVRKPGAVMKTSAMLGEFRSDPAARAEFLAMCGRE